MGVDVSLVEQLDGVSQTVLGEVVHVRYARSDDGLGAC